MKRILSIILFAAGVFGVGQAKEQLSPDQTLWFTSPAENWAQQALHIGNGYMGASFYGIENVLTLQKKHFGPEVLILCLILNPR